MSEPITTEPVPIAQKEAKPAPAKVPESERSFFTLRTFVSATLYGALGAFLGHWLGKLGERSDRKSSRIFLAWAGGIGGAVLAAYTSTRTAQRENEDERSARQAQLSQLNDTAPSPVTKIEQMPPPTDRPRSAVEMMQYEGALDPEAARARAV